MGGGSKVLQVIYMPAKRKGSNLKDSQITIRVNGRIKAAAVEFARSLGLDFSEWIRSLMASELRKAGLLPSPKDQEESGRGRESSNGHT